MSFWSKSKAMKRCVVAPGTHDMFVNVAGKIAKAPENYSSRRITVAWDAAPNALSPGTHDPFGKIVEYTVSQGKALEAQYETQLEAYYLERYETSGGYVFYVLR